MLGIIILCCVYLCVCLYINKFVEKRGHKIFKIYSLKILEMKLKIKVPWGHAFIPLWGKDKCMPPHAFLLSLILCVPELISS